jgi:acyl-CoA thioester hydrolase
MSNHESTYRIYYEDTDALGVVYHGNYVNFFARGRMEWLRAQSELYQAIQDEKLGIPVFKLSIQYHKPLVLDDEILVRSALTLFKRTYAVFSQEIFRYNGQFLGDCVASGEVHIACVSPQGKPQKWPHYVKYSQIFENTMKESVNGRR